jgi:hypothetical protein
MMPEVLILLGARSDSVGSALNALRASLIKAVLTDSQLIALAGQNGRERYAGCTIHLGGSMRMRDARYLRAQAELCIEIARQMSDRKTAENLRAEAARHHAEANEIEDAGQQRSQSNAGPTK